MKFKDLYEKGLDRKVNPAVSASDLSDDTVLTEIVEYVFTPEIIINLYNILLNVKNNQGSHIGIWINGYYGSGKSHFLKYASYCLAQSQTYRDLAFDRLIEETRKIEQESKDLSVLDDAGATSNNFTTLKEWYVGKANVEMVMFNIGDVHDANANQTTAFTTIFWNQFNARRGYNSFNLALAQLLEKALDEDGKFDEFKEYVKSKGYDWERNISRFAAGRLDLALKMAKEVDPALSTDVIRERIKNNDINVSVEAFAAEMKEYLDSKQDKNFRILFFVDEVSQFIGEHRDLLLQLQSLVKRLDEVCESRVWIACTAQQTLEEVVTNVGGSASNPDDEVGKILGRFEVRASLQGTSPEYITQRRILDKKGEVDIQLTQMFEKDKAKLDAQFVLPGSFRSYGNKDEFAAYYPFVPYQFPLIMRVLDSFVNMNYVDKQVKGNERSLINITYSIAKETAEWEVGEFIPFDRFFGPMFQGSMQHLGQRAMENARQALDTIKDEEKQAFYRRVVHALFMICNMAEADKQQFSATIDNVVTLLMTKVDASKAAIKNDVSKVLEFLMDSSVIRKIKTETGSEIYEFYTEEEAKVAQIIKNQPVDSNTYSEELYKIIYNHFGFGASTAKENYATRSFSIGGNVDGKHYLANNADVEIDFLTTAGTDSPEQYAFNNPQNHLVFFLYPLFKDNIELRGNFLEYCRVQRFAQEPAISEERQRTKRLFQERAKDMYDKEIKLAFQQILDTCPVISGQNVLSVSEIGTGKKQERYKNVITRHLSTLYEFAQLVNNNETPKTQSELSSKILRPVDGTLAIQPLTTAEKKVKDYLDRSPHDVTVGDVVRQFAKVPYGWSDFATIYVVNELVRRHLYAFNFNNNPNVSREDTARNIVKESNRFTIEKAKAISQDILNDFIDAWKHIFNVMTVTGSNDSTELYRNCKETDNSALNNCLRNYRTLSHKIVSFPFASVVEEAITLMEKWLTIRDHKEFFETITAARVSAGQLFDRCKSINTFISDHYDNYSKILNFLSGNNDNFTFLPADQDFTLNSLKAIKADMEPWKNMPAYLKMMKSLEGKLKDCKDRLIADVQIAYDKAFDDIDKYAQSVGVSPEHYAKRDVTVIQKTSTPNFYALKSNADTADFVNEQIEKINAVSGKKIAKRKRVTLQTRTVTPLKSESEIDQYLSKLKTELMQALDGNDEIMIN